MSQSPMEDVHIATIVAGYASRADVGQDDILALVQRLRSGTAAVAQAAPTSSNGVTPALPVEKAVTQDQIFCLCCGRGFKMLKRHLGAEHGLTEAEYRALFDLPPEMPLVAPSYSERKAAYARESGLGRYERESQGRDAEIS